jgi:Taurine catabolism dioxygenase TauD, TfdA family
MVVTDTRVELIEHPGAWTRRSIGGKEALTRVLSPAHVAEIDRILGATHDVPPQQVGRAQFDAPALNECLADVRRELLDGRGAVIIQGVTPERYGEDAFERIFWGVGLHLGYAVLQSDLGDRIGHVRHEPGLTKVRGYRSTRELKMHTDVQELVGLMSVQRSETGGVSQLVSSLAIHNVIQRERPDLMPILYAGSPRWAYEKMHVTGYTVPIFCNVDGAISCSFFGVEDSAKKVGKTLPTKLEEAIGYFKAVAERPDMCQSFILEPGEMMLWNNFTCLHARTEFQNSAARQRHLLRLWMDVPDGRKVPPSFSQLAAEYTSG